jgi:hypothetical protein
MKQLLIVCIAALMTATFLAEDAAARSGVRKPRIVIYARPQYAAERGAIYGYAPGYYRQGRNGVLYGPYPLNPNGPMEELCY